MGHIEEARQMVTEQKGRIARLKAAGVDTAFPELTLKDSAGEPRRRKVFALRWRPTVVSGAHGCTSLLLISFCRR
jgi:hypothetical protein